MMRALPPPVQIRFLLGALWVSYNVWEYEWRTTQGIFILRPPPPLQSRCSKPMAADNEEGVAKVHGQVQMAS